ncbi:hypothetical protein AVEN_229466-1 [Araneus ventricosus]|uniref:Uncharacterized protein n=1 Tax=Araneus ventricosus TaxID=182803 RepID=A0A4Y2S1I9_ARAVE|nr:hypothetical protein AVEN_229466-1 [Araneus ventricosus]
MLYRVKDEEFTVDNITKQLITESGRIELKLKDENRVQSVTDAYTAGVRKLEGKSSEEKNTATRSYGSGTLVSFCTEKSGSNRLAESERFESSSIETTITRERPEEFLIDSAATSICNHKDWFSNFKPIYKTEVFVGERDSSAKAIHRSIGLILKYERPAEFLGLRKVSLLTPFHCQFPHVLWHQLIETDHYKRIVDKLEREEFIRVKIREIRSIRCFDQYNRLIVIFVITSAVYCIGFSPLYNETRQ